MDAEQKRIAVRKAEKYVASLEAAVPTTKPLGEVGEALDAAARAAQRAIGAAKDPKRAAAMNGLLATIRSAQAATSGALTFCAVSDKALTDAKASLAKAQAAVVS